MKKLRVPAILIAAVVFAVACDNDDDKGTSNNQAKIQAKWGVTSIQTLEVGVDTTNYTGVAADYYDFRNDGKFYTQVGDQKDTATYKIIDNNKIVLDGDTADIKTLSGSQLVIWGKTIDAPSDTTIVTISLKK